MVRILCDLLGSFCGPITRQGEVGPTLPRCPNGALLQMRLYHLRLLCHGLCRERLTLFLCFIRYAMFQDCRWCDTWRMSCLWCALAAVLAGHRQEQPCLPREPGSCARGLPSLWALAGNSLQQRVCHQNPVAGVTLTFLFHTAVKLSSEKREQPC